MPFNVENSGFSLRILPSSPGSIFFCSPGGFKHVLSKVFVCFFCPSAMRDPMSMERANLLNMAKLSIKGLIESALSFGRTLDSDYPPLQQFFVVMEHCLKHGLRGKLIKMQRLSCAVSFLDLHTLFPPQWRSLFWASTSLCGVLWSWWRNCVLKQQRSPPPYETCLDLSKEGIHTCAHTHTQLNLTSCWRNMSHYPTTHTLTRTSNTRMWREQEQGNTWVWFTFTSPSRSRLPHFSVISLLLYCLSVTKLE